MSNKIFVPDALIQWIKQNTGISILPDNYDQVAIAVREKAKLKQILPDKYISMLLSNQQDPFDIIDSIITPESFFLRYREIMEFVIQNIIPDLLNRGIRPAILCAPCSRGEEPYSFAMLLIEAGIDPKNISITGIDISRDCIDKASRGIYSAYSLRRVPKNFLERHFLFIDNKTVKVHPYIHSTVVFKRMNLLTEAIGLLNPGFHVIFCHNLLIYFDNSTINKALSVIDKLMHPKGWLFVDSAESMHAKEHFKRAPAGDKFGFRKKENLTVNRVDDRSLKNQKPVVFEKKLNPVPHAKSPQNDLPETFLKAESLYKLKNFDKALELYDELANSTPEFKAVSFYKMARIHADQGKLMQALEMAETALSDHQDAKCIPLKDVELEETHAMIALIMRKKGLVNKAKEHFEKLKILNPQHSALRVYNDIKDQEDQ